MTKKTTKFMVAYDPVKKLFVWYDTKANEQFYADREELAHLIDIVLAEKLATLNDIAFTTEAHYQYVYFWTTKRKYNKIMKNR